MTKKFDVPAEWDGPLSNWFETNYPGSPPIFIAKGQYGFSKEVFLTLVKNDLVILKTKKGEISYERQSLANFTGVKVIVGALQITFKNAKGKEEALTIGIKNKEVVEEVKTLIFNGRQAVALATLSETGGDNRELVQIEKGTYIGGFTPESGLELHQRASSRWGDRKFGDLLKGGGKTINVYSRAIECDGIFYPIDHQVTADVVFDGQVQVSRRPTLTRMGLLAPLPGTALIAGMALGKKETFDNREIHVTIAHPEWSLSVRVSPKNLGSSKELANRINAIADSLTPKNDAPKSPVSETDKVAKLREIKELLDSGFINQEEAEKMKREIIG